MSESAYEIRQRLEQAEDSVAATGRALAQAVLDDQRIYADALATQYLTAVKLAHRLKKQLELEAPEEPAA